MEAFRQLSWKDVTGSAYTWLIALPLLITLIWTKRFKLIIGVASFVVFLFLLQTALPPADGKVAIRDLLVFLGGTCGLLGINIYLFFVRD